MGSFSTVRECSTCNGTGKIPKERCTNCAGAGVARTQEEIQIKVPAGIQNGEVIRMTGRGEAIKGGQTGDLYIKVQVAPQHYQTRWCEPLHQTGNQTNRRALRCHLQNHYPRW